METHHISSASEETKDGLLVYQTATLTSLRLSTTADTNTVGCCRSAPAPIIHVHVLELRLCTTYSQLQITDSTSCFIFGYIILIYYMLSMSVLTFVPMYTISHSEKC